MDHDDTPTPTTSSNEPGRTPNNCPHEVTTPVNEVLMTNVDKICYRSVKPFV